MEINEFRNVMKNLKVDLWSLIDTAIHVASVDHSQELKIRRDSIVEKLYSSPPLIFKCDNCENHQKHLKMMMNSNGDEEDNEKMKIIVIKKHLEDPNYQSQESLIDMLQRLLKMDITFNALKETDIGRHVNQFRKHQSNEVRRLVKLLVRKWKESVDEWVRLNTPLEGGDSPSNGDGDSHHNHHNHHKNNIDKEKIPPPYLTPKKKREMKDNIIDLEKLTSARKRLHHNTKRMKMFSLCN